MRLVFMGTPDFSVETLRTLSLDGHQIVGVVTQPDKPKGRGRAMTFSPVKEEAMRLGLPVYQPARVKDPAFIETLRKLAPEAIIVVAFGQLLPKEILAFPPYGCINVHASLLPKYRGAAPIQRAILDGEEISGVTIMRMDTGLDTGDIITKETISLTPEETGGSLFDKLSVLGAKLLAKTLPAIANGSAVFEKQPKESPTPYAAALQKKEGCIPWEWNCQRIERLVRGMNPWPSAYSYLNGKTLKIWEAQAVSAPLPFPTKNAVPGTILGHDIKGLYVQCQTGALCITRLQLEGKKQMDAAAFLRGYPLSAGALLSRER